MTTGNREAGRTYHTMEEYRKTFFPRKVEVENRLSYDDPEELGKVLAQRHAKMIEEVLQEWLRERTASKQTD